MLKFFFWIFFSKKGAPQKRFTHAPELTFLKNFPHLFAQNSPHTKGLPIIRLKKIPFTDQSFELEFVRTS